MKVPDPRLNFAMTLLRSIGKSHLGDLADSCGTALSALSKPLASSIFIQIPGLEGERFSVGLAKYISLIDNMLKEYGLVPPKKDKELPGFVAISTDDGKTMCVAVLKHLGSPVGHVAGISEDADDDALPISEGLWLCASQLGIRIHTILSPGGPMSNEILGRRILHLMHNDGVRAVASGNIAPDEVWTAIHHERNKTVVSELDLPSKSMMTGMVDGEAVSEEAIKYLWSDMGIEAGVWIETSPGTCLAVGFEDRKMVNPKIIARIKDALGQIALQDSQNLAKSFERLKTDFKKLVKSERAAAITETAVTINHEINNPLTAILGNTQLLLMAKDKLPADVVAKLQTIERSAIRIRETTTKLMSIIEPVTGPYASGLEMIDIEKSKKKKNP